MVEVAGLQFGAQVELLSALLDQSHECIKLLDETGRIVFVNRQGCIAMELRKPDEVLGLVWSERWPPESAAIVDRALDAARNGEVARFTASRPGRGVNTHWWDVTVTPVAGAGTARYVTIARDITVEVTERQRVAAISNEMRHRLRNGMAIASGIVTLESRGAPEQRAFAQKVCDRFAQLAHVQELILDPQRATTFSEVIPLLANIYGDGELLRFGALPDVHLSDGATQTLALAFGELATNSLKYGALRDAQPIQIDAVVADHRLCITWREPTRFSSPREGAQGMGLIDRLLPAAGGRISRDIGESLLTVRIYLPVADR